MKINKVVVGDYQTNCYILEQDGKFLIIDPGDEAEKIKNELKGELVGILVTHNHPDHIGAIFHFSAPVYSFSNLEEKEYNIDNFSFSVIFTPGHTEDSITFYFENHNVMFTGDFLFASTIGRCDLPTGDFTIMKESLKKIKKYKKSIVIYPGHGVSSTIEGEMKNNPFLIEA